MIRIRGRVFRRALALAAACASLLAMARESRATTLEKMSVSELARRAAVVVQARCVSNQTSWDGGEVWTFTTFAVEEIWKGATPASLRVRLLGGRLRDVTSTVSGVPRFQGGEEVVLFLEPTGRGDYSVTSWMQGTFRIRRDYQSGLQAVTQDTARFDVYDPAKHTFHLSGIRGEPLKQFKAEVQEAIDRSGGSGR
ncbi:MAG TPA: hypothetical protein VMU43_06640 [Candidatus Acidoferrum sp.]|nr:hypothetical protein [Candidatus Acidoferrum sp.]